GAHRGRSEALVERGWAKRPLPVEQLFDLAFHPNEACNVAQDPASREILATMRGASRQLDGGDRRSDPPWANPGAVRRVLQRSVAGVAERQPARGRSRLIASDPRFWPISLAEVLIGRPYDEAVSA